MIYKVEFKKEAELIDLTDHGYSANKKWSNLTEDQKNEILDPLRETPSDIDSIEKI